MGKMYTFSGSPEGHEHLDVMHKLLKQFVPFAQKRLGFNKPVDINLLSDPQNSKDPLGKTAYYDPNNMKIALFVDKRHPKDLMRSLAHELTHHAQNCRGEFDNLPKLGEDYAQSNKHMREMEREAYEGTMLLRDFEDQLKKETTQMNESKINEKKQKPDFPDVDGDGDREESIAQASRQKKEKEGGKKKKKKDLSKVPPQLRASMLAEEEESEEEKKKKEKKKKEEEERKADATPGKGQATVDTPKPKVAKGLPENWFKGDKDNLLFETLTKKWTK